ncbi:hypothetical protein GCM10007291_15220 [Gemmobacter nanjingensis]|uniref:Uncharacterized protein n=1 Tax=Gemmobacter nanjingensis TaxID=488454 RepID=A0ABQ3FBN8_9RHOB|nr:hypothetical protein [Gemmobacter nanjingensis]GHC17405.1 hypothetical protein GCM10007291_15220 [Gemmobacter nanjingensis]
MRNPAESQDEWEDDEGRIWPVVKLTAYDRRRNELRELEAKRDALEAKSDLDDRERQTLATLIPVIAKAQERFEREGKRAKEDLWRKRRGVDEWRAGEGRDDYNAKRRKVRHHPNADLSDMTPDQKAQYERDRRSDANWFKRQREKGVNEAAITAAYAERLEVRRREREERAEDEAAMADIRRRAIV